MRLRLSLYSSASVRPKARAITRFLPMKNLECEAHSSRIVLKCVLRMLSTENTNNRGYSSTAPRILSTIACFVSNPIFFCVLDKAILRSLLDLGILSSLYLLEIKKNLEFTCSQFFSQPHVPPC